MVRKSEVLLVMSYKAKVYTTGPNILQQNSEDRKVQKGQHRYLISGMLAISHAEKAAKM